MQTISDNDRLTPIQEKLIQALVQYPTLKAAAESVGITDRTANRYMKLPHVKAAYEERQQQVTTYVRKQIEGLSTMAIEALKESLDSPSHLAKIQAIKIVLDRLDPETLKVAQPVQEAQESFIEADLLAYLTDEEMGLIEAIMQRARARKEGQAG